MTIVLELKRGIAAEIYKYRKTFTLWMLILAPAFVPAINFIIFLQRGQDIIREGINPWEFLMRNTIEPASFLFPFFVMVIALFVNSMEYNANTWKLIYTQPLSRLTVYLAKVKVFTLMILFSMTLLAIFSIAVGYSMSIIRPELGFDQPFDKSLIFGVCLKIFLASMGYAAIQFAISQKWKNLILPLGIGIAGVISFMILVQGWEYAEYHPYGYHIMATRSITPPEFSIWADLKPVYLGLTVAAGVFALSGWDMIRKRIV